MFLQHMPNINSLTIPQLALIQTHHLSEKEIQIIGILSQTNRIRKVVITHRECTRKKLCLLFNLCPQIEYLSLDLPQNFQDSIIQFLISKMKENNYRFFFLSLAGENANNNILTKIQSIINQNQLLNHCSLDLFKGNIYLWF